MNNGTNQPLSDAKFVNEISYRIRWNPNQYSPGAHRARQYGTNGDFRNFVPFWRHPDARRIDLRQSLRNPFGEIYVRQSQQRSRIALYVVADLSASMRFGEGLPKIRILQNLTRALAGAAHRIGDAFGFIGCDEDLREEFFLPASIKRGSETSIVDRLQHFVPQGRNAHGLSKVAERLDAKRKLIFLVSDFHLPIHEIEALLTALSGHDVVPIIARCSNEVQDLPPWGLVELRDLESGHIRLTFMRRRLREALLMGARDREQRLERLCQRYGRTPFRIIDRLDADGLSEHLLLG